MKLEVPFYLQTTKLNCGPMALRMVLAYFDKDIGINVLEERAGVKEGKGVAGIQIATAAVLSRFKTNFYSKHLFFNEENLKLDFYKKYADMVHQSKKLIEAARKVGVEIDGKKLALDELLRNVGEDSVPIVLLDWNVVKREKEKGYLGHFVPIVGYDDENVYVHNHGFDKPQEFLPINKKVFDEARKAAGTDEDIAVIYRNK